MPLSYDIDEQAMHATIVGAGAVTMPGMIAGVLAVAADPRFRPHLTLDTRHWLSGG